MWNSKSSVAVACFLPGRAKDLSAPMCTVIFSYVWKSFLALPLSKAVFSNTVYI